MVETLPAAASSQEAELSKEEIASLLEANAADAKTQRARLAALQGKHMLFVAGDFAYPACAEFLCEHLRMLRSHGLRITAVFQQGKQGGKYYEACRPVVDAELFADLGCADGAARAVDAVRAAGLELDGVWSPHEAVVTLVSRIAAALGLPGNPPQAYEVARDKFATREALRRAGLNSIKAVQVWGLEDADMAAVEVGFPMIVKPTSGMGSGGVYRVDSVEDLASTLERVFDDIRSCWNLQNAHQGETKQAPVIAETCVIPTVFADGRINEHDVEVLLSRGELVYANIIDNLTPLPGTYQELGSIAPSHIPQDQQQEMIQYAADAVRAMGFTDGGFHCECWATANGPICIENNARVGGGRTVGTHISVWGVDPMLEFTLSFLGIPINPPRHETPRGVASYALPNALRSGTINDKPSFLDFAKESPHYVDHSYYKKGGDSIKGLATGLPDWIGDAYFVSPIDQGIDRAMNDLSKFIDIAQSKCVEETTSGPEEE